MDLAPYFLRSMMFGRFLAVPEKKHPPPEGINGASRASENL